MTDEDRVKSSNKTNEVINKYISRTLPTAKTINNRFNAIEEREKKKNEQNQSKEGIDYES